MAITLRGTKGEALTHSELDANFTTLESADAALAATDVTLAAADAAHAALTIAHGATGAVVGTTNTQTLTNKTIVAASNTITTASSGTLAATELNAALAELESEKQPINATLTAISDGSLGAFSHRNNIINGGFAINQRAYVSGAATTAGQYTLDRWKVTGTGGITFSTTDNKTTVTIPSGQELQQVIEGLNLQSGTYVLSWEGAAQGKIGAGSLSASGVTGSITGGTNTTIEFGPGTVANVQLEFGSVATPFERRPHSIEIDLCERYYRLNRNGMSGAWGEDTNTTLNVNAENGSGMRTSPTVSVFSGTDAVVRPGIAFYTATAASYNSSVLQITTSPASTVGVPGYVAPNTIAFSAEL